MTTLVLHGGFSITSPYEEHSGAFFRKIVELSKGPVKLCCIYFGTDEQKWESYFEQDKRLFQKEAKALHKEIFFELADTQNIEVQIKQSNTLYIRESSDIFKLQETLGRIDNLSALLQDKVVVGSSAGAYVLSTYYVSRRFGLQEGLGIFPIKVSAHFEESMADNLEGLRAYKKALPTYALQEKEYVVLEF